MGSHENERNEQSLEQASDRLLAEAEQLIWSLLDGELDAQGTQHLEHLIAENEQVRLRYINCVQVHADLHEHFGSAPKPDLTKSGQTKTGSSPVLGFLGDIRPGTDYLPPVQD